MSKQLNVFLHGVPAGILIRKTNGNLQFRYDPDYVGSRLPVISQSMRLSDQAFPHRTCLAVFGGLLPEQQVRMQIASVLGISATNDFALLEALGGECAGAIELLPRAFGPATLDARRVHLLDAADFDRVMTGLPQRPFAIEADGELRLSLAGAQDKLPAILDERGVVLPLAGGPPTTHILKPEPLRFPGLVDNELFCMRLASEVGLGVAAVARSTTMSGLPYLEVERYDRMVVGDTVQRLHQEDLCQAMAKLPDEKYQAEGGPTVFDTTELLRQHAAVPARDLDRFWSALIYNILIGNCDAHGKNYSLLYGDRGLELAPLYDLVSTAVFPELSQRLAMTVGGATHLDDVSMDSIVSAAGSAGYNRMAAQRRVIELSRRVMKAAAKLATMGDHDNMTALSISRSIAQRIDRLIGDQ